MTSSPRLGIQLYSVRTLCEDATYKTTLTQLAQLGFEGVELAWKYGGMNPQELADFLQSIGLQTAGMHVKLDELLTPGHQVYQYAKVLGSPFITTSQHTRTGDWPQVIQQLQAAGRIARDHGLQLTYHNHAQEFITVDGQTSLPWDQLIAQSDPALVALELDLGWAHKAGADAIATWHQSAARTPQIHLRDYSRERQTMCDIGDGFLDCTVIKRDAKRLGTRWVIYEQDAYPISPMDSAKVCATGWREA